MAEIRPLLRAGVPGALCRIDLIHRVVDALAVTDVVEDEELRLRTEIGGLADTALLEINLGLLGDVAGVAAVGLSGDRILDVADQGKRRRRAERIEKRRGRIRNDEHVALLDLLKPADRRAVEADTVDERISVERSRWNRKVLPEARQVGEPQIDHPDVDVLDHLQDIVRRGAIETHGLPPAVWMTKSTGRGPAGLLFRCSAWRCVRRENGARPRSSPREGVVGIRPSQLSCGPRISFRAASMCRHVSACSLSPSFSRAQAF